MVIRTDNSRDYGPTKYTSICSEGFDAFGNKITWERPVVFDHAPKVIATYNFPIPKKNWKTSGQYLTYTWDIDKLQKTKDGGMIITLKIHPYDFFIQNYIDWPRKKYEERLKAFHKRYC